MKFGPRDTTAYKVAQRNFMVSLAGYSVVAYIIKLHDRHNGNILVDTGECSSQTKIHLIRLF